jgi:hypothetical protein
MIDLINTFDAFDFDELASFQRRAFGFPWLTPERARLQRPQYYRWKYSPPAGPAHLAPIRCNGELAVTAAAVPVAVVSGQHRARVWQVCDIATDARFRKQGLFSRCLDALSAASNGEMMFCVPNRQSRVGLTRAGFSAQSTFGVYLSPILPQWGGKSEWNAAELDYLEAIGTSISEEESRPHAERSLEFLRWRYTSHPLTRYTCLPVHASDGSQGFVIVRHVYAFGLRLGLVMEAWPLSDAGRRAGVDMAERWARQTRCLALLASNGVLPSAGHWRLRLKLSDRFVVAKRLDPLTLNAAFNSLLTQIGDWDAL